jgi:hypothetical protein
MLGLNINLSKSDFIPIAVPQHITTITSILNYILEKWPIKYLGLPLTIKKPTMSNFLPLIHKVQDRLAGWKSNYLSLAGEKNLINSTLNALPIHYMQAFKLPGWLLQQIERIKMRFLWREHNTFRGGHALVNWMGIC